MNGRTKYTDKFISELLSRQFPKIRWAAGTFLKDEFWIKEAISLFLLKLAFGKLDRYDLHQKSEDDVNALIYKIVKNTSVAIMRSQTCLHRKTEKIKSLGKLDSSDEGLSVLKIESQLDLALLLRWVNLNCTKIQILVFNLFFLEELKHEEMASKLGISLPASKRRVNNLRTKLKKQFPSFFCLTEAFIFWINLV